MKKLSIIALSFLIAGIAQATPSKVVNIKPQTVFAAVGFDDNDEVTVVVDGYLPDTCYRLRQPEIKKDLAKGTIMIQPKADLFEGVCSDVIIPFSTVIPIGKLSKGEYRIVTKDGTLQEIVSVQRANGPGPDDHLYAPVDSAEVFQNGTQLTAIIRGRFTSTCLTMEDVRVINSGKTFEVLPIMKYVPGSSCHKRVVPFEKTVTLPTMLPGRYLMHVRSVNGQAVNEVFSVYGQ